MRKLILDPGDKKCIGISPISMTVHPAEPTANKGRPVAEVYAAALEFSPHRYDTVMRVEMTREEIERMIRELKAVLQST